MNNPAWVLTVFSKNRERLTGCNGCRVERAGGAASGSSSAWVGPDPVLGKLQKLSP